MTEQFRWLEWDKALGVERPARSHTAGRFSPSAGLIGAGLLQLDQLPLEVGLQMGAMVTLEGSQPFDLLLQYATFHLAGFHDLAGIRHRATAEGMQGERNEVRAPAQ